MSSSLLRSGLLLSLTFVLLNACATTGNRGSSVSSVSIVFTPVVGMRLTYRVTTTFEVSGTLASQLPANQKSGTGSSRLGLEITSVDEDSFSVRITAQDKTFPATFRFARDWRLRSVTIDENADVSDTDRAAMAALPDSLRLTVPRGDFRPGESKPWAFRLATPGSPPIEINGTQTFRRLVQVDGRGAAEFDSQGAGEVRTMTGRISTRITGGTWMDLAAGIALRSHSKSTLDFSGPGEWARIRFDTEQVLDMTESKGL